MKALSYSLNTFIVFDVILVTYEVAVVYFGSSYESPVCFQVVDIFGVMFRLEEDSISMTFARIIDLEILK